MVAVGTEAAQPAAAVASATRMSHGPAAVRRRAGAAADGRLEMEADMCAPCGE